MHAIIFEKATKDVVAIVKDVQKFDENNIDNRVIGFSERVDFILTDDDVPDMPAFSIDDRKPIKGLLKDIKIKNYTNIRPEKEFEKKLAVKREQRNTLLLETDHYMMPDYPISKEKQEEIKDYRQSLRDLPETITKENIDKIEFPEKPNLQTSVKSQ